MDELGAVFARLPEIHRRALGWFLENAGKEVPWPQPIEYEGRKVTLAFAQAGIFKPAWSKYTLSIWQSLNGPYPDQPPVKQDDGSWIYCYYQKDLDPDNRDKHAGNRGLIHCMIDRVPVGVFRQVKAKPHPRYQVLGIAMVNNWDGGFFYMEGFNKERRARPRGPEAEFDFISGMLSGRKAEIGDLDPANMQDARRRVHATIVLRQGQKEFREGLLDAYGGKCAVTRYDAPPALEAAHIIPYRGPRTNDLSNGLLLRGDLHTLFDYGLIAVDSDTMKILISSKIGDTSYRVLESSRLIVPEKGAVQPSAKLLSLHREWASI